MSMGLTPGGPVAVDGRADLRVARLHVAARAGRTSARRRRGSALQSSSTHVSGFADETKRKSPAYRAELLTAVALGVAGAERGPASVHSAALRVARLPAGANTTGTALFRQYQARSEGQYEPAFALSEARTHIGRGWVGARAVLHASACEKKRELKLEIRNRVRSSPQGLEHPENADQPPLIGHGKLLHTCVLEPTQFAPPFCSMTTE